jgi:hypothetical protein
MIFIPLSSSHKIAPRSIFTEDPSRLFPSGQKREVWNRRNFKCDFLILRNQLFFSSFVKKARSNPLTF